MFIHCVYFWLRDDLSDASRRRFDEGVHALLDIESVRHGFVGTPASTDRPIIDRSYSCGLVVVFDDEAGHDLYQEHPIHDRFRNACGDLWMAVKIYDVETG